MAMNDKKLAKQNDQVAQLERTLAEMRNST